jgi:hypothetical protein
MLLESAKHHARTKGEYLEKYLASMKIAFLEHEAEEQSR